MLFFYNRALLLAIAALSLLQLAVALPLPPIEENSLVERREASNNAPLEYDLLYQRGILKVIVNKLHLQRAFGSIAHGPKTQTLKPHHDVSIDHKKFKQGFNNMALPNKEEEEKMINWHKDKIRHAMRTSPQLINAHTARIKRVAHEGGSDPNEKNHISVSFKDKLGNIIHATHNGQQTPTHHIYVGTDGLTEHGKESWARNNKIIHEISQWKAQIGQEKPKPTS